MRIKRKIEKERERKGEKCNKYIKIVENYIIILYKYGIFIDLNMYLHKLILVL